MRKKTALALGLVGFGASMLFGDAKADDDTGFALRLVCHNTACVYDANKKIVGVPAAIQILIREIEGEWYQINFLRTGIPANLLLFYGNNQCTGQAFMNNIGQLPLPLLYDGQQKFYGPQGDPAPFTWVAYQYVDAATGLTCKPFGQNCGSGGNQVCNGTGSPAAVIQTATFTAPFKIKLN